MNETIAKVMEFINNNTLILIGICVFLILVLIGYLIDNSVKSKRVRNDIKNPDQVPENIKDAIIKKAEMDKEMEEANKSIKIIEETPIKDNVSISDSGIIEEPTNLELQNNQDIPSDISGSLDLDSTLKMNPEDINVEIAPKGIDVDIIDTTEENKKEENNNLNINIPTEENNSFDLNVSSEEPVVPEINVPAEEPQNELLFSDVEQSAPSVNNDPDYDIMNKVDNNNGYSNDKKLSEILLSSEVKEEPLQTSNDSTIFSDNTSNIIINNDVKKDDVQIEANTEDKKDSSDELDRIMRKLSAMNNNVEEDSYTNIF